MRNYDKTYPVVKRNRISQSTTHAPRSWEEPGGATNGVALAAQSMILTINGGSSSLKFALFEGNDPSRSVLFGAVDRIGMSDARWVMTRADGGKKEDHPVAAPDQMSAAQLLIDWLELKIGFDAISAVGHRIVHGGSRFSQPELLSTESIDELRAISPYDPDHMPGEIDLIEAFRKHAPSLPQIACFDTEFHHDMPRVAQIVPIPRRYEAAGVRRYGFHGLSYAYLLEEVAKVGSPEEARGRVILAHLGAGASLAAVRGGHSFDTSMGFTPASGLVMGTRSGDLDPGLVRFLARKEGMTADQFDGLVNHKSGLLGVSETSADVRDLLAARHKDVRAAEAIDLFCYQTKKWIGAFAAALGGIDTLVFAGGIGENAPEIRRQICDGLAFLGILLDDTRNGSTNSLISVEGGPVKVRVIHTDEAITIAQAVVRLTARPS